MGRNVPLKKIENITKRQVTFSKRRSSILRKAEEISICCDVDVVFIAFSPAGRITKFIGPKKIEDVICRYVNLPIHRRYNNVENVQDKVERLQTLEHMEGDKDKLQYLHRQAESLELEVRRKTLELEMLQADVSAYEHVRGEALDLDQLVWKESNLKHALEKVLARKETLSATSPLPHVLNNVQIRSEEVPPFSKTVSQSNPNANGAKASVGKLPVQIDSRIVTNRVNEGLQQNLMFRGKGKGVHNHVTTRYTSYGTRGVQSPPPRMMHKPHFVPPLENAFRSVPQCDPRIHSNKVHEVLSKNLVHQESSKSVQNHMSTVPTLSRTCGTSKKANLQLQMIAKLPRFTPPVENAFKALAQRDQRIPSRSMIGNGSFGQTTYNIHQSSCKRPIPQPHDGNLYSASTFNNGQILTRDTQTPNHQIMHPPGPLKIRMNEHSSAHMNYSANFVNVNSNNSGNIRNDLEIRGYIPVAEEFHPQPTRFSDNLPLQDLCEDNKAQTSQSEGVGFSDNEWDSLFS